MKKNTKNMLVVVLRTNSDAELRSVGSVEEVAELIVGRVANFQLVNGMTMIHSYWMEGQKPNQLACDVTVKIMGAAQCDPGSLMAFSAGVGLRGDCVIYKRKPYDKMGTLTADDLKQIAGPKKNHGRELDWSGFQLTYAPSDAEQGNPELSKQIQALGSLVKVIEPSNPSNALPK